LRSPPLGPGKGNLAPNSWRQSSALS
jgi:hypothetical protein